MEYLTSKKILHRDLASRNVLMRKRDHVEVTDFGLSADIQQNLVVPSRMPYRWVAMEILNHPRDKSQYTEASDVWSFGVTCWEILTYAQMPYGNVRLDGSNVVQALFTYLQDGNRLARPQYCSLELYQTLLLCWAPKPITRPTFKSLREQFEEYKQDPNRYVTTQRTIQMDSGCLGEIIYDDNYLEKYLKGFYERIDGSSNEISPLMYQNDDTILMEGQKTIENEYRKISFLKRSQSYSSYLPMISEKSVKYDTIKRSHSYADVVKYESNKSKF